MVKPDISKLTDKQRRFCEEYVIDWNATRAAIEAGYSEKSAHVEGSRLLINAKVKQYIDWLRSNLAEAAGISALWIANEYKKQAQFSLTDVYEDWITRKDFDEISEEVKSCIKKIESKSIVSENGEVERWVKLEFYDKQAALRALREMIGTDTPKEVKHSGEVNISGFNPDKLSTKELTTLRKLMAKGNGD